MRVLGELRQQATIEHLIANPLLTPNKDFFINKRDHIDAQLEIRVLAQGVSKIIKDLWPYAHEAYMNYKKQSDFSILWCNYSIYLPVFTLLFYISKDVLDHWNT